MVYLHHSCEKDRHQHSEGTKSHHDHFYPGSGNTRRRREVTVTSSERTGNSPYTTSETAPSYWETEHCNSTRYTLSLSYFDQVTSALRRMGSLQCWASQFDMAVVEPFLPRNSTFLGVPLSSDNPKNSLRLSDLFSVDRWNKYALRSCRKRKTPISFSSLTSWMEFVQCAPRNLIVVQFIHKKMDSHSVPCTFLHLEKHWSSLFQPHGFKIIRHVCIDLNEYGELLPENQFKKLVFGDSSYPATVVFDEWRGIQSNITKGVSITVQSNCTSIAAGKRLFQIMTPNDIIVREAHVYVETFLMGKPFATVMLRLERFLIYNADNGHNSLKELVNTLGCVRKLHRTKQLFVTTDMSTYGSQTREKHYKNLLTIKYTQQVLDIFYSPDSLQKQQSNLKQISSVNNPAYISTLQKAIGSLGDCLILVGGGNFQKQASIWHAQFSSRPQIITWKGLETCKNLVQLCK